MADKETLTESVETPVTQDDIINLLSEGDDNEDSSLEIEGEDGAEEEEGSSDNKESGSEDEEEGDSETPEKLDLEDKSESEEADEEAFLAFNKKKFLKDYPDAFKKYPALERGFYANRAYREVFPTLADAKEAASRLEEFDQHISALDEGKSTALLKAVKERNPENFSKVVNNYLPNLMEVDQDAYYHIVTNILSDGIIGFFEAGKEAKSEDVMEAARMFKAWMFGKKDIQPSQPYKPTAPEKAEVDKERKQWEDDKLKDVQTQVQDKVNTVFLNTIKANIDPKDQMTPFAKKAAIKEASELLDKAIKNDKGFQSLVSKMWDKAKGAKLSQESQARIRSAYDSKGKMLIPLILRKVRSEAVSGTVRNNTTSRTKMLPRASSPSTGISKTKVESNVRKSTLDLLNED